MPCYVPNSDGVSCMALVNAEGETVLVPEAHAQAQAAAAGVETEEEAAAWLASLGWRMATLEETEALVGKRKVIYRVQ